MSVLNREKGVWLMIDILTLETFQGHLGDTFYVELPDSPMLDFKLETVSPLSDHAVGSEGNSEHRSPFSLLFLGPEGVALPQNTYAFTHDAMGRFEIFVVPVERTGNRLKYQAIFN
jgi:hypothetical protein